jgi:hypothetical protein
VFTLPTRAAISSHLEIIEDSIDGYVSFFLHNPDDFWQTIYVIHNNGARDRLVMLQEGSWNVIMDGDTFGAEETIWYEDEEIFNMETLYEIQGGQITEIKKNQTLIMYSGDFDGLTDEPTEPEPDDDTVFQKTGCFSAIGTTSLIIYGVALLGVPVVLTIRKNKQEE